MDFSQMGPFCNPYSRRKFIENYKHSPLNASPCNPVVTDDICVQSHWQYSASWNGRFLFELWVNGTESSSDTIDRFFAHGSGRIFCTIELLNIYSMVLEELSVPLNFVTETETQVNSNRNVQYFVAHSVTFGSF